MKYKIIYKHTYEGSSQTVQFEHESERDLNANENQQIVFEQLLNHSRQFGGSGLGSVSLISIEAM